MSETVEVDAEDLDKVLEYVALEASENPAAVPDTTDEAAQRLEETVYDNE